MILGLKIESFVPNANWDAVSKIAVLFSGEALELFKFRLSSSESADQPVGIRY
jgi:hypothetical protein